LYLAVVIDLFSRRVIGWAMANHLRTDLAISALRRWAEQYDVDPLCANVPETLRPLKLV